MCFNSHLQKFLVYFLFWLYCIVFYYFVNMCLLCFMNVKDVRNDVNKAYIYCLSDYST